jgi:HAD superfamily hydrolase (TIGR01509 family)
MPERPPPPRAVVFDLDGTLIDSLPLVLRAHHHAIAPFHPPLTDAQLLARFGGPPARLLRALLGDAAQAAEALRRLEEHWTVNAHEAQPFAGARALLADLRARGLALGLWTGRDRASTEALLRAHGLDAFFATSVCGDDLATHKPDAAGLREILQQLAVRADEALYVGDAEVDVRAGAAAGVRTLLIRHGREVAPEVVTQAWRVVETPGEAFALMESLANAS